MQITPEDLMPISLCNPCISKLEICHQLVTSCLEADTNLRAILKFHELFQDEVMYNVTVIDLVSLFLI